MSLSVGWLVVRKEPVHLKVARQSCEATIRSMTLEMKVKLEIER